MAQRHQGLQAASDLRRDGGDLPGLRPNPAPLRRPPSGLCLRLPGPSPLRIGIQKAPSRNKNQIKNV